METRENDTETAHTDRLEIAYNNLVSIIIGAAKDTIGLRPKNEDNVNKPKNFKLSKSSLARNQAGKLWKRACKSNGTQTQALWRKFQKTKKITADSQGNTIEEPEKLKESIQSFLTELGRQRAPEPINLNQVETTVTDPARVLTTNIEEEFTKKISSKEYDNAIKGMKPHKASGFDGIANELLKEGGEHLKQVIILLFDAIIETEWIPPTWREERVTLLHKGGSKRSLHNYRTIAIGSNFGKLFTRILQTRMQTLAESAGWLGDMQNGFRKGRSTMDSLFILTQVMEQALRKRTKVFLLFLDLRKAFDRVWREGLWRVLQRFGLDGKCSRLIQKLYEFHQRKAHTTAGWTEWIQSFIGVKQ